MLLWTPACWGCAGVSWPSSCFARHRTTGLVLSHLGGQLIHAPIEAHYPCGALGCRTAALRASIQPGGECAPWCPRHRRRTVARSWSRRKSCTSPVNSPSDNPHGQGLPFACVPACPQQLAGRMPSAIKPLKRRPRMARGLFGLPGDTPQRYRRQRRGIGGTRQNEKAPALSRWSLQILTRALTHRPTFPQHRQSTGYGARYRNSPGY